MDFNDMIDRFDSDHRRQQARIIAEGIRPYVPADGCDAMDFGCGTGLVGLELIDSFTSVIFVDSAEGMIDRVNQKIASMPKASALHCDLQTNPHCLEGHSFDLIISSLALHHVEKLEEVLGVLLSLLKPSGRLIAIEMDKEEGEQQSNGEGCNHSHHHGFKGNHGFDREEFRALLLKVGFCEVEVDSFAPGEKLRDGEAIPFSQFLVRATT